MCYYMQSYNTNIDVNNLILAKELFINVIYYSNCDFLIKDAKKNILNINIILSNKIMNIGKFYLKNNKFISAVYRFQDILKFYPKTIFFKESIDRIYIIYFTIEKQNIAKKYLKLSL